MRFMFFKSSATGLFIERLVQVDVKQDVDIRHHWPFVRGIHWSPVDSPHKRPVMWQACQYHDVIVPIPPLTGMNTMISYAV